jgi:hypothetical protein
MTTQKLTRPIIEAAILGFESQREKLAHQVAELRAMLDGGPKETATTPEAPKRKRREMSAAGRKAIAEAQRKRWAGSKKQSEPAPATSKPKRKLSKAGRKAISEATKKRWAAFHAAQQAKKPAAKKAVARTKLSPTRKAALVANLAKARAAKAAKVAAGAQ